MTDIFTAQKRSEVMSLIRGKDTQPELRVRHALWQQGLRFRLHAKGLPGRPDLVLPRWKAAVFVHDCFWHAHDGCPAFRLPSTRPDFWRTKLLSNRERDIRHHQALLLAGWRVATVWECAVRLDTASTVTALADWIRCGDRSSLSLSNRAGLVVAE